MLQIEPGPIHRSKDEIMLLEMKNIYNRTGGGAGGKQQPAGGDIAEVISSSISST